jgi:cob(I)alamin adenosyltransferase
MKIYTKTGDQGQTSLLSGLRVAKSNPRLDVYGTVDELNAALGVALSCVPDDPQLKNLFQLLKVTQHRLFVVGSLLACDSKELEKKLPPFKSNWITELEQGIDAMEAELQPLRQFIIPGGHLLAAHLQLARTICRRAERSCASLGQVYICAEAEIKTYLNRLSDYFFVAARWVNFRTGTEDIPWSKDT